MAIGTLDAFVVDVNDLTVAERFWAEVSGLPLKYWGWTGKIARLGDPPASIMLQLVPERRAPSRTGPTWTSWSRMSPRRWRR